MLSIVVHAAQAGALAPQQKAKADARMSPAKGQRLLATRSARFIQNKGQWDARARFLARTKDLDLWFTDGGIRYDNHVSTGGRTRSHVVGMAFVGGRASVPVGSRRLASQIDYLSKERSVRGAPAYAEVLTRGVYPGVDVRSYFDSGKPRYDMILAPGARTEAIRLGFKGDDGLSIKDGALRVATHVGGFSHGKPVAYQLVAGRRKPVAARWAVLGAHAAGFKVGAYDRTKPLVIDPLVFGSYFGGNGGADDVRSVVTDGSTGIYLTGTTYASQFPVDYGPFNHLNLQGTQDAFVSRLQGDAYSRDYSAFVGGTGIDVGQFLKLDARGDLWVAGTTTSQSFPDNIRPYTQFLQANTSSDPLNFSFPDSGDTAQPGGTSRLITPRNGGSPLGNPAPVPGGSFRIGFGDPATGTYSDMLPWNADADTITRALEQINVQATVTPVLGPVGNRFTTLPRARFQIQTSDPLPLRIDTAYRSTGPTIDRSTTPPTVTNGTVINHGLAPSVHLFPPAPVNPSDTDPTGVTPFLDRAYGTATNPNGDRQTFRLYGATPVINVANGGSYTITFRNNPAPPTAPASATTVPNPPNDPPLLAIDGTPDLVAKALNLLANKGSITFSAFGGPLVRFNAFGVPVFSPITVTTTDTANPAPTVKALTFNSNALAPTAAYLFNPDNGAAGTDQSQSKDQTDIFVMRFQQSASTILDPQTNRAILIFGSTATDKFSGFDIRPGQSPAAPVEFALAGSTRGALQQTFLRPSTNQVSTDFYPGASLYPGLGLKYTGFVARYSWTSAGGFVAVAPTAAPTTDLDPVADLPYVRSHDPQDRFQTEVRGVVLDVDGNLYTAGTLYSGTPNEPNANLGTTENVSTVFYAGNVNGSIFTVDDPVEGVQQVGVKSRNYDLFVRKYRPTGAIVFSGVYGGSGFDEAGGIGLAPDGQIINTGSAIAVERPDVPNVDHNIFITGLAQSFDFPRTRGVYGEVFGFVTNIFAAKIKADGTSVLYSTSVQKLFDDPGIPVPFTLVGETLPVYEAMESAGIAADARGYAYITGNLRPNRIYFPTPPGDPNQPSSVTLPTIGSVDNEGAPLANTTPPTYDGAYTIPQPPEFPTTEGFLTVLNDTFTTPLVFTTYIGGLLDDFVYAPYVDPGGDVWAFGFSDTRRDYVRISSMGQVTRYGTAAALDPTQISPLSYKPQGDFNGGSTFLVDDFGYGIWNNNPAAPGPAAPRYIQMGFSRDGYVLRYRINLPSVANVSFAPGIIPGGLGAFTQGTVTLTQPAPSTGSQVVLSVPGDTTAASFDPTTDQKSIAVTVAANATTATFRLYSRPVTINTPVSVEARLGGTYQRRTIQVVPWLTSVTLDANTVVGGSAIPLQGTVTLFANAPVNGAQVLVEVVDQNGNLLDTTAPNSPIGSPNTNPSPVTVPAGQNSAKFTVNTKGVSVVTTRLKARATLLGLSLTSTEFSVTPTQLLSIAVSPGTIASGGTTTATVTLDGAAPTGGYKVNLAALRNGVVITDGSVVIPPSVTIPAGATTTTVTVTTTSAASGPITLRATSDVNPANQAFATLQVDSVEVSTFTLNPMTVKSGAISTGTITLKRDAPDGGARVYIMGGDFDKVTLSDENGFLKKENGVFYTTVAAGEDTAEIKVTAGYFGTQQTVAFNLGGVTQTLTILPITFNLSLNPNPVIGGTNVTATITLAEPATISLNFAIVSPNAGVTASNASPSIPAGQTSTSVTLTTPKASGTLSAPVIARFKDGSVTRTLTINPIGILRIVPLKKILRGSSNGVINLDVYFAGARADLPDNGEITFTSSQPNIVPTRTFRVRDLRGSAGAAQFVGRAQLPARRVSKSQDVTITARYAGSTASTVVTVTR